MSSSIAEKSIVAMIAVPMLAAFVYFLSILLYIFIAIPFYYLWNYFAPTYFTFLPAIWLVLPFWHIVGLMWIFGTLKYCLFPSATATAKSS